MPAKKPQRGGAREGAGRKETGRSVNSGLRLSPEGLANIHAKADEAEMSANEFVDRRARKLKKRI